MSFRFKDIKDTVEFITVLLYDILLSIVHRGSRRVIIYYHNVRKADVAGFEKQMG